MESTSRTPPASASRCHCDRRNEGMPSCRTRMATSSKRSGCRGARIMTARGCATRKFSNALSSGGSSSSTVLPQTSTGPAPSAASDGRRLVDKGRRRGQTHVELKIPGDMNTSGSAPIDCSRALSAEVCARNRSMCDQHSSQGPAKALVAWPRSVRDARIHHRNPRPAGMRQPQKVRPEFGLRQHDQLRPQSLQVRPDRERKVHRKVEDVLFAKALARKLLSSVGGGRYQHAVARKAAPHLVDQSADREYLADRNGMHPNHARRF